MSSTVENIGANLVKLTITISPEEFAEGKNKAYAKKKGSFAIPGFRKGKAPLKVFETHYGESALFEDAFEEVFPELYQKALIEHDVKVVDRPTLDIDSKGEDGSVVFTAEVFVMPEVKLGQYKGIEIQEKVYNVSEEEIMKEIEKELDKSARWVEVADRTVQNGDNIILDFKGMIDGVAFDGGTAEDYMLEDVGSGKFITGFEPQLVGMAINETKDVVVTFPENYNAEELAGKEAVFVCTIKGIKSKELPELDDEFVKDVSEFDTLDEYKADIKKNLQEKGDKNAINTMIDEVVDKAKDNAEIDIPSCMVEKQIDYIVEDMNYRLSFQGLNLETYLQYTGSTMEAFRDECKKSAYDKVKTQLVLDAIINEEKMQAAEDILNREIEEMAKVYSKEVEAYKADMSAEDKGYLESSAQYKTATQFLLDNAVKVKA